MKEREPPVVEHSQTSRVPLRLALERIFLFELLQNLGRHNPVEHTAQERELFVRRGEDKTEPKCFQRTLIIPFADRGAGHQSGEIWRGKIGWLELVFCDRARQDLLDLLRVRLPVGFVSKDAR